MVGLGWNLRHGNMPSLNHVRQRPYSSTQIACRICEQVFWSNQSFIHHIESHIIEDETSSRRLHELMSSQPLTNPYQPNFSFLTPTQMHSAIQIGYNPSMLQERYPFLVATPQLVAPRPPPSLQPQLSLLGRNNFVIRPQPVRPSGLQFQHRAVEESSNDCTKPFLRQLEQTMPRIAELIERDDDNNVKSHVKMLDLSLKL